MSGDKRWPDEEQFAQLARGAMNLHAEVAAAQHHLRYVRNRQQDELHRLSDKYHGTISKITAIAAKGSAK